MELKRRYDRTHFPIETLIEAWDTLREGIEGDEALHLSVTTTEGAEWRHDDLDEFVADYRRSAGQVYFIGEIGGHSLSLHRWDEWSTVAVKAAERARILRVFDVFDRAREGARLPDEAPHDQPAESPTIFIGHGRSPQWRDLKDHLTDKHNYSVEAYEIGARAGHAIRDILESMLERSSFALLVMTSEDEMADGEYQPRQNVVHEAGLFQGRLGFDRAVVLLEEGAASFSNIEGIQQIRFDEGRIRETFGEVLATLSREFGRGAF